MDIIHMDGSAMQTILYGRTSVSDQTIAHQLAQAEAAGFKIDKTIFDEGISGVTTRLDERPNGRRLFDILRRDDVLALRWVDRLGRNYADVTETIREFMKRGVIIRTVINNLTFDGATKDPMQQAVRDALIGFMAATAEAQAEATREAQKAGIAHARQERPDAYRGRKPTFDRKRFEAVRTMLDQGVTITAVAKNTGLTRQAIYRMRNDPAGAERILAAWGG